MKSFNKKNQDQNISYTFLSKSKHGRRKPKANSTLTYN